MCDNSDNDKQNDKQLTTDNNETDITAKDNEDFDNTNEDMNRSKDLDEESQEIKSSDLANPIPSPESESEKRCTSASNAGESEYESADDEEVKPIDDSYEDTNAEDDQQIISQTIDEMCAKTELNCDFTQSETKISAETEPKDTNCELISESIEDKSVSVEKDNISDESPKDNDLPKEEETNESTNSVQISEDLKSDEVLSKEINVETEDMTRDSNEKSDENKEIVETVVENCNNDMNDEYVDEEGGHEDIADMADAYEDMDESDECSIDSNDEENEELKYDKENEDLDAEREEGDGEESNDLQTNQKDKNLDHDEDKRNPQYIPKRGPFYEHDDRIDPSEMPVEPEVEPKSEETVEKAEETPPKPIVIAKKPIETENNKKKTKKKLWNEGDRWGHDLFNEDEQIPKSKDELVNTYGYDIRNEDDPPKARRRRRYGRGPNKYTRQWQDENAYGKGRGSPTADHNERPLRSEMNDRMDRNERPVRNDTNDRMERNERPVRSEPNDRMERNERSVRSEPNDCIERNERNDRIPKERFGSDRSTNEYKDKYDRKERTERKDRNKTFDRMERSGNRSDNSNEFIHKKAMNRNDRPLNENKRYEEIGDRVQSFSTDDFPELPNNDLRKKLSSKPSGQQQEGWKPSSRFSGQSGGEPEDQNEYKSERMTEPMKIIEAIEHNNRSNHNDPNAPNVVRTQTFENSKYSQRRSSNNYEFEEDDKRGGNGRTRSRKSEETDNSGRPIRKASNNSNYSHGKELNDNYRNRNSGRTERNYHSNEESNRNIERYYEDDNYRSGRDRESNYIESNNSSVGLQKIPIEDKSSVINRSSDGEQTRPKRYSSLRQQQRVIPENMSNIAPNTQIPQTSDNRNLSAHQFYDSHPIQTTPYFAETSAPRTTYHPYMSAQTSDASQTHPTAPAYITQPLPQRYIPQPTPTSSGDAPRYIPAPVPTNVVAAPVHAPPIPQPLPQTGPPPPQTVMTAVPQPPPPGTAYIPSFPSGYPQFPPAPPPTHVPPGYPGHVPVPAQQPSPHQLAELYRGGVTYYDTQSQQQNTIRQIPQRRPKAAIPIVPPPDPHSSDGDGDKSYVSVNS